MATYAKWDCTATELLEAAPTARSYSERISADGTVHVRLILPRSGKKYPFRAGTVTRTEASEVLTAFDPDGTIRKASRDKSAEPTYYRKE